MESLEAFNRATFLLINGTPASPAWLVGAAIFIANNLIDYVPILLIGMWLSGHTQYRSVAIRAVVVTLLALGANQIIGLLWTHPRPSAIGLGHAFLYHVPDSSFPSDHVTVLSSVALTLLLGGLRSLGLLTVAVGVLVAWARIFVGVHFPLDMVGAAGVACIAYAIATPLWNAFGPRLTPLAVNAYRALLAWPIRRKWLRP